MNVLFIATYEGLSGASYSLIGMINELKKRNVNPLVVTLKHGKIENLLSQNGIPHITVRGYPWVIAIEKKNSIRPKVLWQIKKLINYFAEIRIGKILAENQIDVVHINTATAGVGFRAAKKLGIPVIWHLREFVEEDLKKTFWNEKWSLHSIKNASCVIAISESVKEKFSARIKMKNIKLIYNGVPFENFNAERQYDIFAEPTIRIIIAGRIDPGKGHREVINAIYRIIKNGETNIRLNIAGTTQYPEYEQELREMVHTYKLEEYVKFLGYRNDIPGLFMASDIVLVASKAEAFGRVTVEAMMSGALVIGADTAGTKELIGEDYGLLYEQGNAESLAETISFSIENKDEMRTIAHRARIHAEDMFTARENARKVHEIYTHILAEKTGSLN